MSFITKLSSIALALLLLISVGMSAAQAPTLVPVISEAFGYQSLAPEDWQYTPTNGLWQRASNPTDLALMAQQSAPLPPDALLEAILPQLGLEEAPESIGEQESNGLTWTLYYVEVAAQGVQVNVDFAISAAEGKTYVVFLQTAPEDYPDLHESVFVPILAAFSLLEVAPLDLPYSALEVSIPNGEVTLSGTLTLPEGAGPFPVVILVSGSGPQDRDETLAPTIPIKPFFLIADHLTRNGIAVLRYDDRGVGQSTGQFDSATLEDFTSDAQAALDFLTTRPEIDQEHLGLLGHSEGGLVAAKLAASDSRLDFVITLAGPSVLGSEVLLLQNQLILENAGSQPEAVTIQLDYLRAVFEVLASPDPTDEEAMRQLTYDSIIAQAEYATEEDLAAIGDLEAFANEQADAAITTLAGTWFRSFLLYDAGEDWARTTIPALAIYGGKDLQVPDEQNAAPFEAAMQAAGNTNYQVLVYPNANHLMQEAITGAIEEYGTLPAEFTPDFLPDLTDWILAQVGG
jgi:hypothetical protein